MRLLMMLFGLVLMVLAGLWFFTPLLDQTYVRHAPSYAQPRKANVASAPPATRSAAPDARTASASSARPANSGSAITTKALAENVMSMINFGTGLIGAWFTYMSYRLQARDRQRRRRDEA